MESRNPDQLGPCRHEKLGRCTNHFWRVMRREGKPGLAEYTCIVWRARLRDLDEYHQAAARAAGFGLTGEKARQAVAKALSRHPAGPVTCPDYRPVKQGTSAQCRYYYLETCILTFPECPGTCDDFLPCGDQRSDLDPCDGP